MDNPLEYTAEETIRELTLRLRRLEFLLLGGGSCDSSDPPEVPDIATLSRENSVLARISQLDKALGALYNRSPTVRNILDLCLCFPLPCLFLAGWRGGGRLLTKLNEHEDILYIFLSPPSPLNIYIYKK